jgi:dihydroorotate dehydrogenase
LALEAELDGIIATNTTVSREHLRTPQEKIVACGAGGLSGAPLKQRALVVLQRLRARVGGRLTLISAGGIESADDVWQRICAGATLVQIYTGFVYGGPLSAWSIERGLLRRVREAHLSSIRAAIGSDATSG